jgi:hypothetical protein
VLVPGAAQVTVTLPVAGGLDAAAATVTENAGSEALEAALEVPFETPITMPELVPTLLEPGVPARLPVELLKVAQLGLFEMENVSAAPFASEAVGVNEYATPTCALVDGVPEIVGAAGTGV